MKPKRIIEVSRMLWDNVRFVCSGTGPFVLEVENLVRIDVLCRFIIGWTTWEVAYWRLVTNSGEKFGLPSRGVIAFKLTPLFFKA